MEAALQAAPSMERNFREYGDLVHLRVAGFHLHAVARLDGIKHISAGEPSQLPEVC